MNKSVETLVHQATLEHSGSMRGMRTSCPGAVTPQGAGGMGLTSTLGKNLDPIGLIGRQTINSPNQSNSPLKGSSLDDTSGRGMMRRVSSKNGTVDGAAAAAGMAVPKPPLGVPRASEPGARQVMGSSIMDGMGPNSPSGSGGIGIPPWLPQLLDRMDKLEYVVSEQQQQLQLGPPLTGSGPSMGFQESAFLRSKIKELEETIQQVTAAPVAITATADRSAYARQGSTVGNMVLPESVHINARLKALEEGLVQVQKVQQSPPASAASTSLADLAAKLATLESQISKGGGGGGGGGGGAGAGGKVETTVEDHSIQLRQQKQQMEDLTTQLQELTEKVYAASVRQLSAATTANQRMEAAETSVAALTARIKESERKIEQTNKELVELQIAIAELRQRTAEHATTGAKAGAAAAAAAGPAQPGVDPALIGGTELQALERRLDAQLIRLTSRHEELEEAQPAVLKRLDQAEAQVGKLTKKQEELQQQVEAAAAAAKAAGAAAGGKGSNAKDAGDMAVEEVTAIDTALAGAAGGGGADMNMLKHTLRMLHEQVTKANTASTEASKGVEEANTKLSAFARINVKFAERLDIYNKDLKALKEMSVALKKIDELQTEIQDMKTEHRAARIKSAGGNHKDFGEGGGGGGANNVRVKSRASAAAAAAAAAAAGEDPLSPVPPGGVAPSSGNGRKAAQVKAKANPGLMTVIEADEDAKLDDVRDELIEMERDMNIRLQSFVRVGDLKDTENGLLDRITQLHDEVQRIKTYIRDMQVQAMGGAAMGVGVTPSAWGDGGGGSGMMGGTARRGLMQQGSIRRSVHDSLDDMEGADKEGEMLAMTMRLQRAMTNRQR